MDPKSNDVSVELPISTLSRILKVTQFHVMGMHIHRSHLSNKCMFYVSRVYQFD